MLHGPLPKPPAGVLSSTGGVPREDYDAKVKLTVAPLPSTEEQGEDGIRGRARYERAKDNEPLQGTGCADRSALPPTPRTTMTPVTHFLASWAVADTPGLRTRDRTLATLCGMLPDADGLGLLVDGVDRVLGRPDSWYYGQYHHALLHGLPAAVAIPLALSFFAVRRARMFVIGLIVAHVHFLCDVVGSRGPGADDIWPLPYLAPLSDRLTIHWPGQWPLNAWPNIVFTLFLIGFAFWRAIVSGYSPVGVFSTGADRAFVKTVRNRWRTFRPGSVSLQGRDR